MLIMYIVAGYEKSKYCDPLFLTPRKCMNKDVVEMAINILNLVTYWPINTLKILIYGEIMNWW
jgi:hypothetical protein